MIESPVSSLADAVPVLSALLADASAAAADDRWWRFLGRLHPLTVHFPIGLALAAAGVEFVNILRRRLDASPFGITATGLAAIAACFAAWFGWLNADHEGATLDNTLFLHRWLGIAGAAGLLVVWLVGLAGRSGDRPSALNGYRWGLIVVSVVIGVGAHFGGEMVYGKGYLTKVLLPPTAKTTTVDASGPSTDVEPTDDTPAEPTAGGVTRVSFQRDVLPIFEARCIECHGPDKVKGSLRMDTVAHLFGEDPEWWTVQPGKPDESLLLERVELPADDPDAMPPKGDRLTPAEIAVIRDWIAEGAQDDAAAGTPSDSTTPSASDAGTGAETGRDSGAAADAGSDPAPAGPESSPGEAAINEAIDGAINRAVTSLRERQILVMPIAQGSDEWEINASLVDPPFGDDDLARLDGLQPVLAWANLARTGLTDAGIAPLGDFGSLTRLRLDNTAIGDGAVDTILRLPKLELLNLYGSRLTDAGLARLATLPSLRRVYCSATAVTPEGVQAAARDGLEIIGPAPSAEEPEEAPDGAEAAEGTTE